MDFHVLISECVLFSLLVNEILSFLLGIRILEESSFEEWGLPQTQIEVDKSLGRFFFQSTVDLTSHLFELPFCLREMAAHIDARKPRKPQILSSWIDKLGMGFLFADTVCGRSPQSGVFLITSRFLCRNAYTVIISSAIYCEINWRRWRPQSQGCQHSAINYWDNKVNFTIEEEGLFKSKRVTIKSKIRTLGKDYFSYPFLLTTCKFTPTSWKNVSQPLIGGSCWGSRGVRSGRFDPTLRSSREEVFGGWVQVQCKQSQPPKEDWELNAGELGALAHSTAK